MAAGGPWSVKGIAPQAREAAKDAARRQGKTLGEWLNEIILETGDELADSAQDNDRAQSQYGRPQYGQGQGQAHARHEPGAPRESLEALARRLEASEHRSTLAITGIDQSVRGLIARLEAAERASGEVADQAGEAVSDLHQSQSELARRLAALEADGTAKAGLEAMKTLEHAVATVAGHVHDRDAKAKERAGNIEDRLETLGERLAKTAEDLQRRVDAASDHAAMQAQRATNDLRGALEVHEQKTGDALAGLEATLGRINQRLSTAENLTDNAMRALEASFANLDDRLQRAEQTAKAADADALAERLEQKFETLGRELRERIEQVRTETATTIEQNAETARMDRLEKALEKANRRNARTLSQIGEQIGVLGQAVERRLDETERRLREDANQDRTLETKLREVESSSASAIRQIAEGVEQISQRLAERIEASEQRSAETVATLGKEMSRLADRVSAPQAPARDDDALAARLRESERRTQQMIRDAVAGVSAKLDAVRDESESGLSPVQGALASLASRLEAIENGADPDAPPAAREEARPSPLGRAPSGQTLSAGPRPADAAGRRSFLPPAEEALSALGLEDEGFEDPSVEDAEPEEEIAIVQPERPNPFTGDPADLTDDEDDGWSAEAHVAPESATPPPAEPAAPARERTARPAPAVVAEPASRDAPSRDAQPHNAPPLGATADSNFLAAARKSARSAPADSGGRARARGPAPAASVLENRGEDRANAGSGRRVLVLAGMLAVVTLAGAAALLFRDGLPFQTSGARVASDLDDPAMTGVLNGGTQDFAVVDGAPRPAEPLEIPAPEAAAPETILDAPAGPDAAEQDAPALEAEAAPEPAPAPAAPAVEPPAPAAAQAPVQPQTQAQTQAEAEAPAPAPEPEAPPAARIVSNEPQPAMEAPAETAAPLSPREAAMAAAPDLAEAAFQGDAAAQYQLGEMQLQSGDAEEGARLIRSAANQGLAPAQYRLGKLYETGAAGVPRDDLQARLWTERAANAGNRNAMHNLALMYAEGRGAEQNDAQAAQWFENAALLGATDSQFNLAVLYEQGRGVPQSLPDAYAWYRIADIAGDSEAGERADLIAAQIPPEAAAEAGRVAEAFQPRQPDPAANGAFAAGAPGAVAQAGSDPVAVQRAQQFLAELGYNPGTADGFVGPQTRLAIIQYQRDAGMEPNGTVDAALLARLQSDAAR